MRKNRIRQTIILALALFVSALPLAVINAQSSSVSATRVCGELVEQFSKHYLELRPIDAGRDMELVMFYNPNDNQALRNGSGFVVFNGNQFEAAMRRGGNLFHPAVDKIAVGSDTVESGLNIKRATLPGEPLSVVVANDSTTPLDYCLSGTHVTIVDQSGEQVRDPNQPMPATTAAMEEADAAEIAEGTATSTPAATATPAVTAAATVTETASVTVQPTVVQTTTLEGVLSDPFQVHIYPLEVANIRQNVEVRLNDINNAGIALVIFTEDQFNTWINSGLPPTSSRLANSIVAGPDASMGDPVNIKRTNIQQPARRFMAVVHNIRTPDSPYELSLVNGNGVLIDGSAQSITAQELLVNAPDATTATTSEESSTATTTASDATTTPAATTAANAIEIGGTYTVVAGDTMGTIARRAYGDLQLYDELCAYNNIANCNRIEVGDQIQIPARTQLDSINRATATSTATAPPSTPTTATPVTATATPTATTATVPGTATGNIVQMAASFNSLDTLELLLELLGLEQDPSNNIKATLSGTGPYTIFAPVDTAFTALSEETLERLIADPTELANVLKFHIVPGTFTTADLTDGMTLDTLSGASLTVGVGTDDTITIDGVPIVQTDIAASNGVIHAINTVLTPPSQ